MFEQTFKNIDDILHKDSGCGTELDYVDLKHEKLHLYLTTRDAETLQNHTFHRKA